MQRTASVSQSRSGDSAPHNLFLSNVSVALRERVCGPLGATLEAKGTVLQGTSQAVLCLVRIPCALCPLSEGGGAQASREPDCLVVARSDCRVTTPCSAPYALHPTAQGLDKMT